MAPPLARAFSMEHLAALDDEALGTFVAGLAQLPGAPERIGVALRGPTWDDLAGRVLARLPVAPRALVAGAREAPRGAGDDVPGQRRWLVDALFWPLLYWHAPAVYDQLVSGEELHPGVLDTVPLEGRDVADLGAGAGRFTLMAAPRARSVVAVDAVPALLDRLDRRVAEAGLRNVETRRGDLGRLPLATASVDVAVACSSLQSRPPYGGDAGVAEAVRVVRPGGFVAVVWPDDPAWFCARGFTHVTLPGPLLHRFGTVERARRLCRLFAGEAAAAWVDEHRTPSVPYPVMGMRPPADLCLLRVPGDGGPEPGAVRFAGWRPGLAV